MPTTKIFVPQETGVIEFTPGGIEPKRTYEVANHLVDVEDIHVPEFMQNVDGATTTPPTPQSPEEKAAAKALAAAQKARAEQDAANVKQAADEAAAQEQAAREAEAARQAEVAAATAEGAARTAAELAKKPK